MIYWFFICFLFGLNATEPLIKAKIVKQNEVYFHLSAEFSKKYAKGPLHLIYPSEIDLEKLPASIVDIPLIGNVIAAIWFSGKEYSIEEMDEDLYHSLLKIKEFFKRFFYNTSWEGELKVHRLVKNIYPHKTAMSAALFTAGLDSTTTVFRHFDENPTLISFNDPHIGAARFAKELHLDFYTIYMNYDAFLKLTTLDKASLDISKWFWDTSMGLAWVGAAAPFLYAMGIPTLYIPSGFHWKSFLFQDGETLRQPASPLIDENLSPAGLKVQHDPFTMSRTDKIKFISNFCEQNGMEKPGLIVCNHHAKANLSYPHCNKCVKCRLTMLDILATGEHLLDYGFTLKEEEFTQQFQDYITDLEMKRGGTYAACYDTQKYLKQNIEILPQTHREFFNWLISIDLYAMLKESSDRPLRAHPFSWDEYEDLYPGVKNFTE